MFCFPSCPTSTLQYVTLWLVHFKLVEKLLNATGRFLTFFLSIILMYMYMYVLNIKAVFCCRSFPGIFGTQQEHYMQVIKQMLWQCLQDQSSQQVNFSPPISCFPLCDICLSKPRLTREQAQPLDRWRSLLTSNRPIQHFHKQNTQPMLIRFTNNRATATVKLENT